MIVKTKKSIRFSLLIILYSVFYILFPTAVAQAASAFLFLTPAAGAYNIGRTFPVMIQVNTTGAAINAAEGLISFDLDKLSVVSISKTGSVFNLWTDDPAINGPGIIKFGGGAPNPGYSGAAGTIFTVTFKAERAGDTTISFISGSVLANDGKGTNILSSLRGANYSLNPGTTIPRVVAPVEVAAGTPAAPNITSTTHPDPDFWYAKSTAELEWSVPSGIKTVRLLFDKLSTAVPTKDYTPPINKKTIEDIEDGVWYFHARFANANGFGQIAHFPIKVDTTPPKQFQVTVDNSGDLTNPSPILKFNAVDETSGIAQYEMKIGNKDSFLVSRDEVKGGQYKLSPQEPGTEQILVKAIDRAGNFTPAAVTVTIESIEAPVITHYPERVSQGNQLIIDGIAIPDAGVIVFVKREGEATTERKIKVDEEGNWRYIHAQSLERGAYSAWAITEDARGARSEKSETVTIAVSAPLFLKFGEVAIDYLTTMITLIVLIFASAFAIFYGWYSVTTWRKRLRKEVHEVEGAVTNAFQTLNEDIQEQFETLEGVKSQRELTKEEKKILAQIKENLKITEKFISKEIKDVEREVE